MDFVLNVHHVWLIVVLATSIRASPSSDFCLTFASSVYLSVARWATVMVVDPLGVKSHAF